MARKLLTSLLALLLVVGTLPKAAAVDLDLKTPSCVLMDAATGTILYEVNAHERLAPASVTKVMTMLLVMEAIDSGKISWDDKVTASEAAAAKGGSHVYLKVGETMTVSDMVKAVAVASANDCACALAEHLAGSEQGFVERMNQRAQELGMNDTHFVNCTGLDDGAEASEHLTSAYDIAIMSRELLVNHPDIKQYTTIWMDTLRDGTFGLSNTNKLVRFYEGATGLKTGFTRSAGYCLSASAQRDGMELIAVVLHCETTQDRFESAKALLNYGFATYALLDAAQDVEIPEIPVKLGAETTVQPVLQGDTRVLTQKGAAVEVTIDLPETLTAPVQAGQALGTLTATVNGEVVGQYPLVSQTEITRRNWLNLTLEMLKNLCMAG